MSTACLSSRRIQRFGKTTRWFHWSFALSFLTLAATGGALAARNPLVLAEDTIGQLALAHRVAGVALLVGPLLVWLSGLTRETTRDILAALRWTRQDVRWLLLQPLAAVSRAKLPAAGKLNGGQKLNALLTMLLAAILVTTGIWLWREPGALVPWFVHLTLFLLWIPLFMGHFYLAVVNRGTRPALRGMLEGTVSIDWAMQHHEEWAHDHRDAGGNDGP